MTGEELKTERLAEVGARKLRLCRSVDLYQMLMAQGNPAGALEYLEIAEHDLESLRRLAVVASEPTP